MVRPERRTRGDLLAAAAIVAVVATVIAAFWWFSSARATTLRSADGPAPSVTAAQAVPQTLRQLWTAASGKTPTPVVVGGTVVTGDGRAMAGLDAQTGAQRWLYARDAELCAVSYVYDLAVAVYPDRRGCGQVSGVKADTGSRGPSRTSYADRQVVVTSDGTAVLSFGPTRLELWRSDLVRMLSYGEIDARVKPANTRLGRGCTLMSAAASESAAAVLEVCPGGNELDLKLIKPAKEEDEPETKKVDLPGVAPDSDARVLAVAGTTTAVYLPTPEPRVAVYDETGTQVSSTPLGGAPTVGAAPAVSRTADGYTWWSGSAVLVFDAALGYRYRVEGTGERRPVGPATEMAGRLLVPVAGGIAVCDGSDGRFERLIALSHPPGSGPVRPVAIGATLIEQRDGTIAAFGPTPR